MTHARPHLFTGKEGVKPSLPQILQEHERRMLHLLSGWWCRVNALPRAQAWLFPAPWAWALLAVLGLVTAAWFPFSSLTFIINSDLQAAFVAIMALFGVGLLNARRGSTWLAVLTFSLSFFIATGILGRSFNYLVTSLNLPYQDALLDSFHELIGFDWRGHVLWLNQHPAIMKVLQFAYASYAWMMPLTLFGLVLAGRHAKLREFLLLFALTGFACMIIGGFLPAMGTYGYYGFSPAGLENIPDTGTSYLADMESVRAGTFGEFIVSQATGLTTFPSFHTVMALLFAQAWRGTWLQWPVRALAILTIIATPVMGGHYLVDLVGGVLVFLAVLRVVAKGETSTDKYLAGEQHGALPQAAE